MVPRAGAERARACDLGAPVADEVCAHGGCGAEVPLDRVHKLLYIRVKVVIKLAAGDVLVVVHLHT